MTEPAPRSPRALLFKLAVAGLVLVVAAVLVLRGLDLKALLEQSLALVRNAGPGTFFIGMALLPTVGVPLSFFSLTAGSVFGQQLGMGWVIGLSMLAITFNMTLAYCLARWIVRPLLEKLLTRLGYRLPQAGTEDATDLIILLRVTGLPFAVQNYLLGLAGLPLGKYLFVSSLIQWPTNIAFILFGDALLHGKGRAALVALSLLVALTALTHLLRKHYAAKKAS